MQLKYKENDEVSIEGKIVRLDDDYGHKPNNSIWFIIENDCGERFYCTSRDFRAKIGLDFRIKCETICSSAYISKQYGPSYKFEIQSYELCNVVGRRNLINYLSSKSFPYVGRKKAEELYAEYGDDTYDMLCNHFDVVCQDVHLSDKQKESLSSIADNQIISILMTAFPHMNFNRAQAIMQASEGVSGYNIVNKIKAHPYDIVSYCGVYLSVRERDDIYLKDLNGNITDDERVNYLFALFLEQYCRDMKDTYAVTADDISGIVLRWMHSGVPFIIKVARGVQTVNGYQSLSLDQQIQAMGSYLYNYVIALNARLGSELQYRIVVDNLNNKHYFYTKRMYDNVILFQSALRTFIRNAKSMKPAEKAKRLNAFNTWYASSVSNGMPKLNKEQLNAVQTSVTAICSIITGGPGRGKTYTASALLGYVKSIHGKILMLAPTGRAVNKLKNDTGYEDVETIARFLKMNQDTKAIDGYVYDNKHNELRTGKDVYVIIDEVSMLNLMDASRLFYLLMSCNIILMGDINQLPPIESGNVMHEIIKTNSFFGGIPISYLTQNMRTGYQDLSDVVDNTLNGTLTIKQMYSKHVTMHVTTPIGDESEIDARNADEIISAYNHMRQHYDEWDIMIMTPMKDGQCGTNMLNKRIRDICNPVNTKSVTWLVDNDGNEYFETKGVECPKCVAYFDNKKPVLYRIGDRVMRVKDNDAAKKLVVYEDNIIGHDILEESYGNYNGDSGVIVRFEHGISEDSIYVLLDSGYYVKLCVTTNETAVLSLSYAITGHKAQGSEAAATIVAIPERAVNLNRKHLIPRPFLTVEYLNTVFSRAKEELYVVGTQNALEDTLKVHQHISRCKIADTLVIEEFKRIWSVVQNDKNAWIPYINVFSKLRAEYGNDYIDAAQEQATRYNISNGYDD